MHLYFISPYLKNLYSLPIFTFPPIFVQFTSFAYFTVLFASPYFDHDAINVLDPWVHEDQSQAVLRKWYTVVYHMRDVWLIGRVRAFRPEGRGVESHSRRHVGTLGKSLTRSCLWRFGVNSGTVSVLCRERF